MYRGQRASPFTRRLLFGVLGTEYDPVHDGNSCRLVSVCAGQGDDGIWPTVTWIIWVGWVGWLARPPIAVCSNLTRFLVELC